MPRFAYLRAVKNKISRFSIIPEFKDSKIHYVKRGVSDVVFPLTGLNFTQ